MDYSIVAGFRLIIIAAVVLVGAWFDLKPLSMESMLIIAIGFTILDRQQAWSKPRNSDVSLAENAEGG